jgi:hypothetical protein
MAAVSLSHASSKLKLSSSKAVIITCYRTDLVAELLGGLQADAESERARLVVPTLRRLAGAKLDDDHRIPNSFQRSFFASAQDGRASRAW